MQDNNQVIYNFKFTVAPAGFDKGFAKKGEFFILDPGAGRVMGVALLASGDRSGARRELEAAAHGSGPAAKVAQSNLDAMR